YFVQLRIAKVNTEDTDSFSAPIEAIGWLQTTSAFGKSNWKRMGGSGSMKPLCKPLSHGFLREAMP
ncbi:MAG: hypothetical protein MZV63_60500, partial [Marinilabiliales bacterium]|nr:hypothetical protein [Marinilabiliales bacterium]